MKQSKVKTLGDLHLAMDPEQWRILNTQTRSQGSNHRTSRDIDRLLQWVGKIEMVTTSLQYCLGWEWRREDNSTARTGWNHETKWWKSLMEVEKLDVGKLNEKWGANLSKEELRTLWKITWQKRASSREGFWWWRTWWQGFWNGHRAARMNVESTKLKHRNAALWALAAEMYKVTWRERNDAVFRDSTSLRPLRIILLETSRSVASWISKSMPERHNQLALKSLETVMELQRKLDKVEPTLRGQSTPHEHDEDEDLRNTSVGWPEDGNGVLSINHHEEEGRADYMGSDEGAHDSTLHDANWTMPSPVGRGTDEELSTNHFSADNQVLPYELAE
ncbi:hypothetical protein R1sor_024276 [Riccia sorocarpa]|uniref:Uncharacterized protein n=1 Tax=Riccia sorocarpa TaxID=122646 RepID=A0ABD3GTA5_9MARC